MLNSDLESLLKKLRSWDRRSHRGMTSVSADDINDLLQIVSAANVQRAEATASIVSLIERKARGLAPLHFPAGSPNDLIMAALEDMDLGPVRITSKEELQSQATAEDLSSITKEAFAAMHGAADAAGSDELKSHEVTKTPAYYSPMRSVTRGFMTMINKEADVFDIIAAWGLGYHLGEALAHLLRLGRKPGEDIGASIFKIKQQLDRWQFDQECLAEEKAKEEKLDLLNKSGRT